MVAYYDTEGLLTPDRAREVLEDYLTACQSGKIATAAALAEHANTREANLSAAMSSLLLASRHSTSVTIGSSDHFGGPRDILVYSAKARRKPPFTVRSARMPARTYVAVVDYDNARPSSGSVSWTIRNEDILTSDLIVANLDQRYRLGFDRRGLFKSQEYDLPPGVTQLPQSRGALLNEFLDLSSRVVDRYLQQLS